MAQTEQLEDALKKIMLAGVGAAATTAEKSKELLDKLAQKGGETVEQGKALNEELKHNRAVKKTDAFLDRLTSEQMEELKTKIEQRQSNDTDAFLDSLTSEQMEELKAKIQQREADGN